MSDLNKLSWLFPLFQEVCQRLNDIETELEAEADRDFSFIEDEFETLVTLVEDAHKRASGSEKITLKQAVTADDGRRLNFYAEVWLDGGGA